MEVATFIVGDARPYPYGVVFNPVTHKRLPPGVDAEDGKHLAGLPVMRTFEMSLDRREFELPHGHTLDEL